MCQLAISTYPLQPPTCVEHDSRAVEVAQRIARALTTALPQVSVEHIGSTAVPGCAGKGIVDLMVLYPEGHLETVKEALQRMGFQRQTFGHLFPESRPMRVGALQYDGDTFRVHVHVIAASSPEAAAMCAFRQRLCTDPALVAAYVRCKRSILAESITDPRVYTRKKSTFVQEVLSTTGNQTTVMPPPDNSHCRPHGGVA